jgi:hypothetical protein
MSGAAALAVFLNYPLGLLFPGSNPHKMADRPACRISAVPNDRGVAACVTVRSQAGWPDATPGVIARPDRSPASHAAAAEETLHP